METVKIDDPKLDENFSFLFAFRKGDVVVNRNDRRLRGEIHDGVYVGQVPSRVAGELNPRGKTLYEIKFPGEVFQIADEKEIEKVAD